MMALPGIAVPQRAPQPQRPDLITTPAPTAQALALSAQPAPVFSDPKYANQPGSAFVNDMDAWSKAQGAPTQAWGNQAQNWAAGVARKLQNVPAGGFTPQQLATINQQGNPSYVPPQTPPGTVMADAGPPQGMFQQRNQQRQAINQAITPMLNAIYQRYQQSRQPMPQAQPAAGPQWSRAGGAWVPPTQGTI